MHGFYNKPVVIDGKNHLMGRLASVVAKQLLQGNRITVVRCEEMNISGNFYRNKLKYLSYLRKRCNINPARGPFHFRAPNKMFRKAVRGMLPHKTQRGKDAMRRFRAYEGVPPKYHKKRLVSVPGSMRTICLRPGKKFCTIGQLSHEVGWKYQHIIKVLEQKRKAKLTVMKKEKKQFHKLTKTSQKVAAKEAKEANQLIKSFGHK